MKAELEEPPLAIQVEPLVGDSCRLARHSHRESIASLPSYPGRQGVKAAADGQLPPEIMIIFAHGGLPQGCISAIKQYERQERQGT